MLDMKFYSNKFTIITYHSGARKLQFKNFFLLFQTKEAFSYFRVI